MTEEDMDKVKALFYVAAIMLVTAALFNWLENTYI